MKNDTTLCAWAMVVSFETQKCRKWALAPSSSIFLLIGMDRKGFRRMKEEGWIYNTLPQIF